MRLRKRKEVKRLRQVNRREIKYLLTLPVYYRYADVFANVLQEDKHSSASGYMVRSLYFDTPDNTDFHEKEDGTDPRRKVRLRCYDPTQGPVLLELKQKEGVRQLKRSLSMTREDAQKLIDGHYEVLLGYKEPFAKECYGLMRTRYYRPCCIVEYRRRAFVMQTNNIRITFDSQLRSNKNSVDLFSTNLPLTPIMDDFNIILEVKYDGFLLSYIRDILAYIDKNEISAGKYYLGRL